LKTREIIYEVEAHAPDTKRAVITPHGRRAVFTINKNIIHVADLETKKRLELNMFNSDWATDYVAISPDGSVVSGGSGFHTLLFDFETTKFDRREVKYKVKETNPSVALAMTNSGRRVFWCLMTGI
jgi:hypothetical protein